MVTYIHFTRSVFSCDVVFLTKHLAKSSVNGPENRFKFKPKIRIKVYLKIFFTCDDKLFNVRNSIIKSGAKTEKSLSCLDLVPVSLL